MTPAELDFIKDAFSQIIDDIAGNPNWHDAASAVSADLGALERELEGKVVSPDKSLEEEICLWISENENIHHGDKLMVWLLKEMARYFAKWGAEHFHDTSMIDKSMEEAADTYKNSYSDPNGALARASKRAFIAGWKCRDDQMPMPEDTVLFQKGVAEGRRLEREDSVECEVTDVGLNYLDLALFEAERLGLNKGDKVRIVVLKAEEE